ncbi:MAG: Outer membrane protein Omp38 precursor [Syntrophus sp. PtaU1.Bin208]|nr:MAG: Outer membrane protein Omp38 precursor [Syntrophus sp. PtaU1.Bin208]
MHRKRIFKILAPLAMFALIMGCATQKAAPVVKAVDLNPKIASGQMVQKVDSFEVIFDATRSMNDPYKLGTKLNQEKALISLFDETIPKLKLNEAARAFGQFTMFGDATSKNLFGPTAYSKSALPNAVAPFTSGSGLSPLDQALDGATADLKGESGQLAVIAFSDGEDMEAFQPVAAAQRMKNAYGDRVCIYTVLLGDKTKTIDIGDKNEGVNMMQQVADAGKCGFMVTGESVATPEGMADFVEKVFLKAAPPKPYVAPPPAPEPAPAPAPAVEPTPAPEPKAKAPAGMILKIQFAPGKADIQPKYKGEIEKIAEYLKQNPEATVEIQGHTDNVASRAANMKLSQSRADSVKDCLVKDFGIDASRIKAVGYGQDKPIASNATPEGRQKNRRVSVVYGK